MPRRRASTPTPTSDLDSDLLAAMESSSPFRPTQASKHSHGAMAGNTDEDSQAGDAGAAPPGPESTLHPNDWDTIELVVEAKCLRTDQASTVYAIDRTPVCHAKLSAQLFGLENQLNQVVPAQAAWTPTASFKTNTAAAALAILLSSKTNVYKGDGPTKILMKIIVIKGWDVTEATLKNQHSRKLVKGRAQYHLTQARSKIKKPIVAGLKPGGILNILDLTSIIASKGNDVVVNEVLCARIALMRAVYVEHPDDDFWDFLNLRIESISKAAAGDSGKIVRAFHHVLTVNQKKYNAEDVYEIEKTGASAFQDDIDGMIVNQTMVVAAAGSEAGTDPFVA
ncbi:hypothetical protein K438DRAFT_1953827 [Mycena galopus ATCC 62051]|nr:hypothetical protein K438DRAFT_1953827 [Mycena galopus ATCC 62051]